MTGIHLTLIDLDTPTARALGRRNQRPDTAVITVRPDTRRPAWLARDLLAAVGIRHSRSGQTRRDADDRQLVPVWLHAHQVRDVIVVGVESLPAPLLPELIELATLADTTLWLVADHLLPGAITDVLADWPIHPCPPTAFRDRWLADTPDTPDQHAAPRAPDDELPELLPAADFTLFRATARRQLPDAAFDAVDARWQAALDAALDALTERTDPAQVLRDAVGRCQSAAAVTITTRAVQAAAWRHGHHLRVDLDALLAHDDHAPVAAADDPATWEQLHTYRQPVRQAGCALTLLGVAPTQQLDLTLDDLDLKRPALHVDGRWRPLPERACPTLHALRASRLAAGAQGTDPLMARMDGQPVSARTLADAVNAVRQETGLRLTVGQVERDFLPTTRWARRRHVTCTALDV